MLQETHDSPSILLCTCIHVFAHLSLAVLPLPGMQDVEFVVAETHKLKELQETPDAPEALQCMPSLKLSDIPKTISKVSMNESLRGMM